MTIPFPTYRVVIDNINHSSKREVTMKYISAKAGKLVKKLEGWVRDLPPMESKAPLFRVASGEDADSFRPNYDFNKTQAELEHLRKQIHTVKHAINVFNTAHSLPGFDNLTIDQALVYPPDLQSERDSASNGGSPSQRTC